MTPTDPNSSATPKQRFYTLDGLRGMAALLVVAYHLTDGGHPVPNGFLAVDFFFIMSGFIVSHAYNTQLFQGRLADFVIRRVIRLYPMAFLGAILSFGLAATKYLATDSHPYSLEEFLGGGSSLLLLPYLFDTTISVGIFVFNPPLWSVFFELLINVVFALAFRMLTTNRLIIASVICIICVGHFGIGGGARSDFFLGFPRVAAGFFCGVLVYRAHLKGFTVGLKANFYILAAALVALAAIPITIDGWLYIPTFMVLLCIVVISTCSKQQNTPNKIAALLGNISYPLYATHWISMYMFAAFVSKTSQKFGSSLQEQYLWVYLLQLLLAPVIAAVLYSRFEKPIQSLLRRYFSPAEFPIARSMQHPS